MSKLTDYYIHDASLNEKGEQAEPGWEQLEDKLLREELLPELLIQLKTTLSKVKRPLMLNISYDPNGTISVSFTKNCIVAGMRDNIITDDGKTASVQSSENNDLNEVIVETVDERKESTDNVPNDEDIKKIRNKSVGFKVTFPDGTVFHEKEAVYTFIYALQKIGLARIASDNRNPHHAGFNVVDTRERKDSKNKQKYVDGYYVYTNLGNDVKIDDLTEISSRYNIGLIITIDESEEGKISGNTLENESSRVEDNPIQDAILITSDNIRDVKGRDMRITVNGRVFQENNAIQTFIEALKYIGLDNVAKVGIVCSGYNLVDTRQRLDDGKRWQQQEGDKWVYVYFSNTTKVNYLNQIADFLNLNIKIEAI